MGIPGFRDWGIPGCQDWEIPPFPFSPFPVFAHLVPEVLPEPPVVPKVLEPILGNSGGKNHPTGPTLSCPQLPLPCILWKNGNSGNSDIPQDPHCPAPSSLCPKSCQKNGNSGKSLGMWGRNSRKCLGMWEGRSRKSSGILGKL